MIVLEPRLQFQTSTRLTRPIDFENHGTVKGTLLASEHALHRHITGVLNKISQ